MFANVDRVKAHFHCCDVLPTMRKCVLPTEQICTVYSSNVFGGDSHPPNKITIPTPKRLPNCVLWFVFFSTGTMSYKYHGNFLLLDNKHRKLFVIKQSEWCKFMPKMHQNALSQDPYPQWGLLVRGRRKGRGPTPKAKRGSNFPASTVKVGRNKHCQAGNTHSWDCTVRFSNIFLFCNL